jgi:hypothetical protein
MVFELISYIERKVTGFIANFDAILNHETA